jgi:hypothetical protein
MDEVHSKLVDIMQDRLVIAAKQLVTESEAFKQESGNRLEAAGASGMEGGPEVSHAIRGLTKQLGTLRSVLSPILQKEEVRPGRGVSLPHSEFKVSWVYGLLKNSFQDTLFVFGG